VVVSTLPRIEQQCRPDRDPGAAAPRHRRHEGRDAIALGARRSRACAPAASLSLGGPAAAHAGAQVIVSVSCSCRGAALLLASATSRWITAASTRPCQMCGWRCRLRSARTHSRRWLGLSRSARRRASTAAASRTIASTSLCSTRSVCGAISGPRCPLGRAGSPGRGAAAAGVRERAGDAWRVGRARAGRVAPAAQVIAACQAVANRSVHRRRRSSRPEVVDAGDDVPAGAVQGREPPGPPAPSRSAPLRPLGGGPGDAGVREVAGNAGGEVLVGGALASPRPRRPAEASVVTAPAGLLLHADDRAKGQRQARSRPGDKGAVWYQSSAV
jgi:hypothetical protein